MSPIPHMQAGPGARGAVCLGPRRPAEDAARTEQDPGPPRSADRRGQPLRVLGAAPLPGKPEELCRNLGPGLCTQWAPSTDPTESLTVHRERSAQGTGTCVRPVELKAVEAPCTLPRSNPTPPQVGLASLKHTRELTGQKRRAERRACLVQPSQAALHSWTPQAPGQLWPTLRRHSDAT